MTFTQQARRIHYRLMWRKRGEPLVAGDVLATTKRGLSLFTILATLCFPFLSMDMRLFSYSFQLMKLKMRYINATEVFKHFADTQIVHTRPLFASRSL
jgi:hypothetical protein